MGINLALGVLFMERDQQGHPGRLGLERGGPALPYSVACLVFSLTMVPAGRLQDRIGPRVVATVGGVLVGRAVLGRPDLVALRLLRRFRRARGSGFGSGYARDARGGEMVPAGRTGLVAGLVVGGFGLASVFVAPLGTGPSSPTACRRRC